MELFEIPSADGTAVPLSWFPAEQSRWSLLFLPALGIQCRMYDPLAARLAASGCSVLLMEQRGLGRSKLRASRKHDWGYDQFLENDIPASLAWLETQPQSRGRPLLMGGHSLGGHLSSIICGQHPERLQGVLHVACGFPYHADFDATKSRLIRLLCRLVPLFRIVPGYFPGNWLGFAGRESLQVMNDWRDWATGGSLDYGRHHGLQHAISQFTGALLAVSMEGDELSSPKAEQRSIAGFTAARRTEVRLGRDVQGERLGHFGWARPPDQVATAILQWLVREFA
jgi:predicted alpha/beta hydrolase